MHDVDNVLNMRGLYVSTNTCGLSGPSDQAVWDPLPTSTWIVTDISTGSAPELDYFWDQNCWIAARQGE